jgi:hypothetical protein
MSMLTCVPSLKISVTNEQYHLCLGSWYWINHVSIQAHTHVDMIKLVDYTRTATHACYFLVSALLPPNQITACDSNNIK